MGCVERLLPGLLWWVESAHTTSEESHDTRRQALPCPALQETINCNTKKCPPPCIMGDWGKWSTCSETCGWGQHYRKRSVNTQGSKKCGGAHDSMPCHLQSCGRECPDSFNVLPQLANLKTEVRGPNIKIDKTKINLGQDYTLYDPKWAKIVGANPQGTYVIVGPHQNIACKKGRTAKSVIPYVKLTLNIGATIYAAVSTSGAFNKTDLNSLAGFRGFKKGMHITMYNDKNKGGYIWSRKTGCGEYELPNHACGYSFVYVIVFSKPRPCEVSAWGEWSKCTQSCASGLQSRTRTVTKRAEDGGAACPGMKQTQPCNEKPCPIDCVVKSWGAWGKCTQPCGGGTQTTTRGIRTTPQHGGKKCPALKKNRECNPAQCPCTAKIGAWSAWSKCGHADTMCDTWAQKRRTRSITGSSKKNEKCPGSVETQPCFSTSNCKKIDCEMYSWTAWAKCTQACGGGVTHRTKAVKQYPRNGGKECPLPSSRVQQKACNKNECPDPPCGSVGQWTRWSKCSTTCGIGFRKRTRRVAARQAKWAGKELCASDAETVKCIIRDCPPMPCKPAPWNSWSPCSQPCGSGNRYAKREVRTPALYGGDDCTPMTRTQRCTKIKPCDPDCKPGSWSRWSACSASCSSCGTDVCWGLAKRTTFSNSRPTWPCCHYCVVWLPSHAHVGIIPSE